MSKKWTVLPPPPEEFVNQHPELPPTITGLLWHRGLKTQEQIDEFLNPDYSQDLHDPFLFNDMRKALEVIFTAIKNKKNIVVHGDYDADGVCAAAIIITALRKLGAKHVSVFLPHREIDGYGLNINTVNSLYEQKTDLIITCDCGISNLEEIKLAKKLGMDLLNIREDCIDITQHLSAGEKKLLYQQLRNIRTGIETGTYGDMDVDFADSMIAPMNGWSRTPHVETSNDCKVHLYRSAIDPFGRVAVCDLVSEPFFATNDTNNHELKDYSFIS